MEYYTTSLQHILAELERIDILIEASVGRARQLQKKDDDFQGLYISDQEVDALMARPLGLPRWATVSSPCAESSIQAALARIGGEIAARRAESVRQEISLRLVELEHRFELSRLDIDALLICLASELDLRYERIYAYLQDDVTKKRPSVDLILNLLCPSFEAKLAARERFALSAPLLKYSLVSLLDDPSYPRAPLLNKYLKLDERVANHLLGSNEPDARLLSHAQIVVPQRQLEDLVLPAGMLSRLTSLVRRNGANSCRLSLYFQGPYGVGKQTTAEGLCRELGLGLMVVEIRGLLNSQGLDFCTAVRLALREALLQGAALYWKGFDALLHEDQRSQRETLLQELGKWRGLTFLAGEATYEPADALKELSFVRVEFARPTSAERLRLWTLSLNGTTASGVDWSALADKFRFSGGQICDAAATAENLACLRDPDRPLVTTADLYEACKLQSNRKLSTLARKIKPHYTWEDIVLPADRVQQLREICNSVKYRSLVYDEWGFDRKLSLGKGLNILFAGPSGTGKTMAAEIMAGELGLDLYKIDLSTVVSKYIGETEKNLSRIFAEAATSNSILFFDEADALFGKRSEVRDSHDRYANIEINYLLQEMEEYEGIVILATNLRKNMDDAFVRRMHFAVEFPFPNPQDRLRIWESVWPEHTPRGPDLDPNFMAQSFEITGGSIRNIALTAAFLAADDGGSVEMAHLIRAAQREYQKMGKVVVKGEFGDYAGLAETR